MASGEYNPLQGMSDITTPDIWMWQMIEKRARALFSCYDYQELRTPSLEKLSVFQRSIGDTTDVVQKEMYAFEDRGGRNLALRPEGTAGTIRHLAGKGEEGLNSRVYYMAPMFRCERPQAGRKRQFHQIGVEATGAPNPLADAECIALQQHLLEEWGLSGAKILINTRGTIEDRQPVVDGLTNALQPHVEELCEDCQRRIHENVLRVIDCKNKTCAAIVDTIPSAVDFMSEESRQYLDTVVQTLKDQGIDAQVDPKLVRGLDYYVHTVWEITHDALGAQNAIAGGGRYEIALGKKGIPGVGFAMGVERIIMSLEATGVTAEQFAPKGGTWLVSLGEKALSENMKLARILRSEGIACGMELSAKSMKAQMRKANRANAAHVLIRGDEELAANTLILKDMEEGSQKEIALDDLINEYKNTL